MPRYVVTYAPSASPAEPRSVSVEATSPGEAALRGARMMGVADDQDHAEWVTGGTTSRNGAAWTMYAPAPRNPGVFASGVTVRVREE